MSSKSVYRVDVNHLDREFMEQFANDVKMLVGMTLEIVRDNPAMLLSPVMRQLLIDKAKAVESRRLPIFMKSVFIDNPGEPLQVHKP